MTDISSSTTSPSPGSILSSLFSSAKTAPSRPHLQYNTTHEYHQIMNIQHTNSNQQHTSDVVVPELGDVGSAEGKGLARNGHAYVHANPACVCVCENVKGSKEDKDSEKERTCRRRSASRTILRYRPCSCTHYISQNKQKKQTNPNQEHNT